jgi:hypothetical protein
MIILVISINFDRIDTFDANLKISDISEISQFRFNFFLSKIYLSNRYFSLMTCFVNILHINLKSIDKNPLKIS